MYTYIIFKIKQYHLNNKYRINYECTKGSKITFIPKAADFANNFLKFLIYSVYGRRSMSLIYDSRRCLHSKILDNARNTLRKI